MIKSFAGLLIATALAAPGQAANGRATLLAAECEASEHVCNTQHLVRYRFTNGALKSREIIFTATTSEVRFDIAPSRIDRNRYVITDSGDVIDARPENWFTTGSTRASTRLTHGRSTAAFRRIKPGMCSPTIH